MAQLTFLEKLREEYGEKIDRDGIMLTHRDLFDMFDSSAQEFEMEYILKGSVIGYGGVLIDIQECFIDTIASDWCDRIIRIRRNGMHGEYMNELTLPTNDFKEGYIQVYYSHCNWIDIFIAKTEDETTGRIHLCFAPRMNVKEE